MRQLSIITSIFEVMSLNSIIILFGLKNAPATFQQLINSVLTEIQGLKCLVYLDDIMIYGSNLREHNKRLIKVLKRLRESIMYPRYI